MKRRLIALLLSLMTVLSMFPATALAASSEDEALGEVRIFHNGQKVSYLSINGRVREQTYTYYNYEDDNGSTRQIPAYCVNPNTAGVPQTVPAGTSIKYMADQKSNDPKVFGIVASGYPHKSLEDLGLSSVDEGYYATKMALWCYLLDNWDISDLTVNPGADQAAAQRVLAAAKDIYQTGMYWNTIKAPRITATPDQDKPYPATVDGKEYLQQVYTVESETWVDGGVINISFSDPSSVPEGTRIVGKSGNDITGIFATESTGSGFSGEFTVLIPKDAVTKETSSIQLSLDAIVHEFAIFYASCAETDQYGNIQNYMVDTDPRKPMDLDIIIPFEGTPDNPPPENPPPENPPPENPPPENPPPEEPPEPGVLRIIKRETGTLELLDGAIFEVVSPSGDTIGKLSTVNGEIIIPNVEPGNYTVIEKIPPKDHLLSAHPAQNITVREGETAEVTFDNDPYGELRVEKISNTGEKLAGVHVQIKHIESGRTYSGYTEPGGAVQFTKLKPGAYEVQEIAGIAGWKADTDTIKTVTVVTGETSTVTFTNKELPGLRIIKYDRLGHQVMANVTFCIYRDGEFLGNFYTGELGEIVLTDQQPGTYRVFEKDTGDEVHILDTTPQEVELHAGDGIKQLVFFNDRKPGIHLIKVDSADPSVAIPNAKFEIKSVDGSFGPKEFVTQDDGTIDLSMLPVGAYVVTEVSCPGYVIDNAQRIIQLDGNETAQFIFTNSKLPSLRLIKTSAGGGPLPGVSFRLTKIEDGSRYLDRITSSTGEILWEGLEPGVFSLQEIATVSDHIRDPKEYHVELFPGKTSEIVLKNDKRPNLIVYKHDADSGEEVPDTVFTVRAADGHSVDDIRTDRTGRAILKNLLPGVYEISEKSVPSPWLKDAPAQLVTLYPNRDHTVYFKNHKRPVIEIIKENAVTFERQANVPFQVWYASNNTSTGELNDLGTFYTDENGRIELNGPEMGELGLRDGWFRVKELEPLKGFAIADPDTQEAFVAAGQGHTFVFRNRPLSAICVWKYDSVNPNLAIEGAVFQIRYLSGNTSGTGGTVIGTFRTSANGSFTATGLQRGTYIIEELSSDGNHVIDTPPQTVYISGEDQEVIQVYFGNSPKGSLLVKKVSGSNNAPLSDVEFFVTTADGTVVGNANGKFVTDGAGTFLVDNVDPNTTLVVKESRSKPGYLLDDTPQTAQIKAGQTVTLEFRNQPLGSLVIHKYSSLDRKTPLAGVQFKVTYAPGCVVDDENGKVSSNGIYYTGPDGTITINGIVGTVVISEQATIPGYTIDPNTRSQTIVVNPDDVQHAYFYNTPKNTLIIEKYIEEEGSENKPLKGVTFLVTDSSGAVVGNSNGEYISGEDGRVVIPDLEPGSTITAREVKVPDGVVLDGTPKTIKISDDGANILRFYNKKTGYLVIRKLDKISKQPLANVEFELTYADGSFVDDNFGHLSSKGRFKTNDAGEIRVPVVGTVVAKELTPCPGYVIDESTRIQTITVNPADTQTITVYNEPLCTLTISKRDAVSGKPVPNTEFTLRDGDGNLIGRYTTGADGTVTVTGLIPNSTVVVFESRVPSNYVLDPTPQTIIVRNGNNSITSGGSSSGSGTGGSGGNHLDFENDPKTTLTIEKYLETETGNQPLKGVTFLVTDSSGAVVGSSNGEYITGEDGRIVIPNLEPGITITAREVKVPDGVVLDTAPKSIQIKTGEGQTLRFINKKVGTLVIRKLDKISKQPLANVEFELTYADGSFVDDNFGHLSSKGRFKTNDAGEIRVPVVGTVVAKELTPCPGYVIDESTRIQTITVNPADTQTITVYNEPLCTLTISKRDAVSGKPVPNTEFTLRDGDGNLIGRYTTGADGTVTVTGLIPNSTVVVFESRVPSNYVLDPTPQTIIVRNGNNSITSGGSSSGSGTGGSGGNHLDFENDPKTTLVLQKFVDGTDNEPIQGVEFLVTDGSGAAVGPNNGYFYSDKDGRVTIPNVEPGAVITARETKTVDNFLLDGTPQTITIKAGESQSLTFWNKRAGNLIINKVSGDDQRTPLAGVKFKITYADGSNVDQDGGKTSSNGIYTTDSAGQIRISHVVGTVIVTELESVPGFLIDPDNKSQTVTINPDDTQTLTFVNKPAQTLTIQKLVTGTKDKPLAGVEFLITDSSGAFVGPNNGVYKTDLYGRITLTNLTPGTVITAKETKSVDNFVLDGTPQSITIKEGESQTLTFYNAPAGGLELIKVNEADKSQRIPGVTFEIRRMDGALVDTVTTDKQGRAHLDLDAGDFYAVETEAGEGFKLDATPTYFTIQDGKTTTVTITNKAFSGILIHKTDSVTGEGLYNVKFLVYDANKNPIGEYSTDDQGYIYIDDMTVQGKGKLFIRELEAAEGYELDEQYKTVYVQPGKTVEIEWTNTPITGQFQIYKYAAEYNEVTGTPAGAPLKGAVYEISQARSGKVVDYITTDARGVAASKPLPLGRYKIVEVTPPAYWQISGITFDETLEYSGQIIKISDYDKPSNLGVTLTKRGNAEVLAGSQMRYDLTVANTSNVPLEGFYWHDRIPTDAATATVLTTGTYSTRLNYRILYKTSGRAEYQVLASNLLTNNNYSFNLNAIPTQAGEAVTDIYFEFGKVPVGFQSLSGPTLTVTVRGNIPNNYQLVNRADAGGKYQGTWQTAQAGWVTIVRKLEGTPKLPKTGY